MRGTIRNSRQSLASLPEYSESEDSEIAYFVPNSDFGPDTTQLLSSELDFGLHYSSPRHQSTVQSHAQYYLNSTNPLSYTNSTNWLSSDPYIDEQTQLERFSEPSSSAPPSAIPPSSAFPSSDYTEAHDFVYHSIESPMASSPVAPSHPMWDMNHFSDHSHSVRHSSIGHSTGHFSNASDSEYGSIAEQYGTSTTIPDAKSSKRKRLSQTAMDEMFAPSKHIGSTSETNSLANGPASSPPEASPIRNPTGYSSISRVKTECTDEAPNSACVSDHPQEYTVESRAVPKDTITPDTSLHEFQFSPAANYLSQLPDPAVDISSPLPDPLPPNLFYKTGASLTGSYNLKYHNEYGVCPDNWLHPEQLQLVPAFFAEDLNDRMQSSEREEYEESVPSYTARAFSYIGGEPVKAKKMKCPKYAEGKAAGQFMSLNFRSSYNKE